MFAIPNCSTSIGIHVLLAMAFGFTEVPAPGSSIPADGSCKKLHGEMSCYFKGSTGNETMGWYKAKERCSFFNSTLPAIRNKDDQDVIAGYLKSHIQNSEIWTAGTNFTYSTWTWINGKSLIDSAEVKLQEIDGHQYGSLDENSSFTAHAASEECPYICQYQSEHCDSSTDIVINMSGKCLRLISDSLKWYDARNQCLMTKGDLAVIGDDELAFLKQLELNQSYWIGLRKKSFRWTLDDAGESNDEIIYTNWDNGFASVGECISIDASAGKWKALGCSELKTVVCQRVPDVASTTTTTDASAETTHTFTPVSEESTITGGSQSSTPQGILFVAVGVGIIVVICIIVIVVFILRTKNGRSGQSKLNDGYIRNNGDELNTRISNAPVYTSINEPADVPVDRSDDIRGVYADIALLTPEQSEDEGTNQQPGIVYASLDFNKDSTNQEPDKTHAISPTKVGPLGDIYAIPDVKGHAVTSPGDESPSHPVKVTPQGDVYAIPMKMSTSPTVSTQTGAVYANLQPATLDKEQVAEENDETK